MSISLRAAIGLACALALTGCATTSKTEVITTRVVDTKPKLKVKSPKPVKLDRVEWVVVNSTNLPELLKSKKTIVFYAVTPNGYKSIQTNQGQLLRLVGQQKAVIAALKKYYDEP